MNVLLDEMGIGRLAAATTPPIVMGSIIAAEQTSTDDVLLDVEAAVPMESKGASTTSAPGIVASVDGRWGKHVFQIQFTLRDGNLLTYGGTGYGRKCEPFTLHEGERIVRVTQHWSNKFHGARILVDSSEGRQFKVIGVHSTVGDRKIKVQADDGCEIVGLAFEGGMLVGAQVRSGITGQVQLIDSMECVPKLTGTDVGAPTAEPATAEPATAEPAMVEHATAESARLPGAPVRVEYAAGGVDLRPLVKFGCCFVTTWLLHVGNLIATLIVLLIPRDPCEAGGEVACPGSLLGIPAPYPMPFAVFIAFFTTMQHFMDSRAKMRALREKTLEAPRLATELQLREYVQSMQTARVELCFHVLCHHEEVTSHGKHGSSRERVVTHEADYPCAYTTCLDQSTLKVDWEGGLTTGEWYAVAQSGLTWSCATEADKRKFKAAKKRCFDDHHHRDRECDVTVVERLPGFHAAQVYRSTPDAPPPPWPLRCLDWAETLLGVFGLTVPLLWWRSMYYTRRVDHRVHKVISFAKQ